MKAILAMSFVLISSFTYASEVSLIKEGKFVDKHKIGMFGYKSAKECKKDGGKFDGSICLFDSEDTVEVTKLENGNFQLAIEKVGTNAHICSFESEAVEANKVQLKAILNEELANCELTVSYTSTDSLSIITNNQCNDFCGANMVLDIESATRSK